jgi:hypothetical protein
VTSGFRGCNDEWLPLFSGGRRPRRPYGAMKTWRGARAENRGMGPLLRRPPWTPPFGSLPCIEYRKLSIWSGEPQILSGITVTARPCGYVSLLHFTPETWRPVSIWLTLLHLSLRLRGPGYREIWTDPFHNLAPWPFPTKDPFNHRPWNSALVLAEALAGETCLDYKRLRSSVSLEVPFLCQYRL